MMRPRPTLSNPHNLSNLEINCGSSQISTLFALGVCFSIKRPNESRELGSASRVMMLARNVHRKAAFVPRSADHSLLELKAEALELDSTTKLPSP